LATDEDTPTRVDAMNLKDRFCDIEADRRDCLHDEILRILVTSSATDSEALARPVEGAIHSITNGHSSAAQPSSEHANKPPLQAHV
jgi:hypothetical protein